MEQTVAEIRENSLGLSSMDRFAASFRRIESRLVDSAYCLEILADTLRYEEKLAPLVDASEEVVGHWERHYFELVAGELDVIAQSDRGAGPVNMIPIRLRAIGQIVPFVQQETETSELLYSSRAVQRHLAYLDRVVGRAGFSDSRLGLEMAKEVLPSERQYNGE